MFQRSSLADLKPLVLGFEVSGLGFKVYGLKAWSSGFRV